MGRQAWVGALVAGALVLGFAGQARAQWRSADDGEGYGTGARLRETCLRVGVGSALFVHGAVSEDATDPADYSEAFGPAFNLLVELEGRLNPQFALHGGLGYLHHFGGSDQNVDFDDWPLIPLYVGAKFFPRLGSKQTELYVRLDLGLAVSQPVDIEVQTPFFTVNGDFYESSTLFYGCLGVGVAHRPTNSRTRFGFEIGYRLMTGPDIKNSSDRGELSGAITVLATIGVFV